MSDIVSVDLGDIGRIYDAKNKEVENCIEANLKTGECESFAVDINGQFIINAKKDAFEILRQVRPAPMRIERNPNVSRRS